jgi:hypothetical protein
MPKYIAIHGPIIFTASQRVIHCGNKALFEFLYTKQYQSVKQIKNRLISVRNSHGREVPAYCAILDKYIANNEILKDTLKAFVEQGLAKEG